MTRPLLRTWLSLALVAFVLAACGGGGGGLTGAPAASVGGVDISDEQLTVDMVAFRFLVGLSGSSCGTPAGGETTDAACARFTLTNEIQEEIVKAYAGAHDLAVTSDDVQAAIGQLEQNLGGADALDAQLHDAGLTRAELVAIADRLVLFNVVEQAVADEQLTDAVLQGIYEQAKAQFTTVEVSHILLDTRREAQDVAAQATPENFGRLAKQLSTDANSATSGGSLGSFSEAQFRQQFDPTFVEAALALQPGEVSGVVHTQFGYHVIELVRRDVANFDDVRDQLSSQQAPQVFQTWLQGQYDTTQIDVNPRYGRLDESTGQVVPIRSTEDTPGPTGATGASGATAHFTGATGATAP